MKLLLLSAACAAIAGGGALGAQAADVPAASPALDALVARHVEALGGAAALHGLRSMRLEGEMLVNGGAIKLGYVQTVRRPNLVREETSLQGMTIVQAYDGRQAWQIQPFQGRKDAENVTPDEAKDLIEDADIDSALVDWRAKGYRADLLGQDDVDGSPTWKIRVIERNGDELTYYLDTATLMIVRLEARRFIRGQEKVTVSDYGDYEKVGGVYFPFAVDSGPKGVPDDQKQKLTLVKGEANVAVEDTAFRFPAGAKNAVKASAAPPRPVVGSKPPQDQR